MDLPIEYLILILVGGLEHEFLDFPYVEESSQLTNIFQRGWNHQPEQFDMGL